MEKTNAYGLISNFSKKIYMLNRDDEANIISTIKIEGKVLSLRNSYFISSA